MTGEGIIGAALTLAGVWIKTKFDAHVATKNSDVELAKIKEKKAKREDEVTGAIVIEERSDRRRMEAEIKELRDEVTTLSVELARCEERHRISETRIIDLETKMDLLTQLAERQRLQIDNLVRAAMGGSIPPGAP